MSIICSTLIEKNGKYLLVNAKIGRPKGLWNHPGGHQNENESFEETAKRETLEETGFDVEIGRLIGIYVSDVTKKYVYEAKIIKGELKIPENEIKEAKWFTLEDAKKLKNITISTLKSIIDYSNNEFGKTWKIEGIP